MKITLLPYDSCLKIGREVTGNYIGTEEPTEYLPVEIFGRSTEVEEFNSLPGLFSYCITTAGYVIPLYFISYVFR